MITHELQTKVETRLFDLLGKVRATRPDFPSPRVRYYDNRLAAGLADFRRNEISFNSVLLTENEADMLRETVAHELAHIVVWYDYTRGHLRMRPTAHGSYWKRIMRYVFGVEPSRTHNYNVSNVKTRHVRKYAYSCGCRVHHVTSIRHNRIQTGTAYRCNVCKQSLTEVKS